MDGTENQQQTLVITGDFSEHLTQALFISTFFVIFAHIRGCFTEENDTIRWFGTTFCTFVPYVFFIVSGLLLGKNFRQENWYRTALKKRIFTLLIPFLLWCVLFHLIQLGNAWLHGGFHGEMFQTVIRKDTFGLLFDELPCNVPLWYLRTLIYFVLLSPLFARIVKCHRYAAEIFGLVCIVVHIVLEEVYYHCGSPDFRYLSLGYFDLIGMATFVWGTSLAVWPDKFARLAHWRDMPPPQKTKCLPVALLLALHVVFSYCASLILGKPGYGGMRILLLAEG